MPRCLIVKIKNEKQNKNRINTVFIILCSPRIHCNIHALPFFQSLNKDSVVGREIRGVTPFINQMSAIITILGYPPLNIDRTTFGGRITYYRHTQEITPQKFGQLIPAVASTVRDWERGNIYRPNGNETKLKIF